MAAGPKLIEEKYKRILSAWKNLATDKTFGGITIEQFEAQIEKSNSHRQRIDILDHEMKDAQASREAEDRETLKTCDLIVKNVLADLEYGDDSVLYEKMGYIRRSDRKSGLIRKKSPFVDETP
jgi:hypothetical protein